MSKIIGVTVGTTLPKPNFDQTDPNKGDYIRGDRTFITPDETLTQSGRPAEAKATGDAIIQMQTGIDEVSVLIGELDNKYYTETEIDSMISDVNASVDTKSDINHEHSNLYYDKEQANELFSQKSQVQIITWGADD